LANYPPANGVRNYWPLPSFVTGDGSQIGWSAPLNPFTFDLALNSGTLPPTFIGLVVPCRWGRKRGFVAGYIIIP
jgi:hypothetical protein